MAYFFSPESKFIALPAGNAVPKLGVPSTFQVNGCILTSRSHPGVEFIFEW